MTVPEMLLEGLRRFQAGDFSAAESLFRRVLSEAPDLAQAHHLLGVLLAETGRTPEAAVSLGRAAELLPGDAETLNNLGGVLRALGRLDEAAAVYQDALAAQPSSPDILCNLGGVMIDRGEYQASVPLLQRAITLAGGHATALHNLGVALRQLGRPMEAEATFRRALGVAPDYASAYMNLALVLLDQDRWDEALAACQEAEARAPSDPEIQRNLANILRRSGGAGAERAEAAFRKAIALKPDWAALLADFAAFLLERNRCAEAAETARQALANAADLAGAYRTLGYALLRVGRDAEAFEALGECLRRVPAPDIAVRRALLVPVVPADRAEIHAGRERMRRELEALIASGVVLEDPARQIGPPNFYLAYHGLDDRPLEELTATFFRRSCPDLTWEAPHCRSWAGVPRDRPIRLGVLSPYFIEGHTIGKLLIGLIECLPRDRFEVILFRDSAPGGDGPDRAAAAADRVVILPADFRAARGRVAAEELDVLFYPDIGMAPRPYFLAFARLAPVQCVTWGHPTTTGLETIDYFLSSVDLDPPGSERAYTETLVRFPRIGVHREPPLLTVGDLPGRAALRLPEDRRLYVCTQTLFKLHPDFDAALAGILERDRDGLLVFIGAPGDPLAEKVRRRLDGRWPGAAERLLFVPPLTLPWFLGLSVAADVLLDTFPFCGGNTSYEAFAYGAPVVTLPTDGPRGRFTAALYRQMEVSDLIAEDAEHYAALAVRVATDRGFRAVVSAKIRDAAPRLFEDAGAATAFRDWLLDVVGQAHLTDAG